MDASAVFSFAPIHRLHDTRARDLRAITHPAHVTPRGGGVTSDALHYALAHHLLEGAETAARSHDTASFDWYSSHPDANARAMSICTVVGPRVVLAPALSTLTRSAISETPYYVLGPDTVPASDQLRELATSAYAAAAEYGFGDLLAAHAAVVCLLRQKAIGETLDSWTITRLPGTIFCDHTGDRLILARDLIHEAGHNWLNDALTATGCTISDEARFFSPWKKTLRPAFGFLHACWAFPLTMLYVARVLDRTSGDLRRFLAAYLAQQRDLLTRTTDDHAYALELVADPDLRERLQVVYQEALAR